LDWTGCVEDRNLASAGRLRVVARLANIGKDGPDRNRPEDEGELGW
jgi:hypothetical protein